jgi:hypothetical protein
VIQQITISDRNRLADSWFKAQILDALNGIEIDWVDENLNQGDTGIVSITLMTPKGEVMLD